MRPTALATSIGCALVISALSPAAHSYERQWHLGAQVGYGLAGFETGPYSGFGGGAILAYGVTDFMNLRVHGDVTGYPLPDPATTALIWNGGAGVEFVFDVVQVVPYIGATVGAADVAFVDGDDNAHLSLEVPAGALYSVSRDFALGAEIRYRVLLPDSLVTPLHNMTAFARIEYVWGY